MSWPTVALGDVCEFKYGKGLAAGQRDDGRYAVYGSNGIVGAHSKALTAGPTIIIGRKGSFGEVAFSPAACWPIDTTYYVDSSATEADLKWLSYRLRSLGLNTLNRAAAVPGLNREDAYRQLLLLPPKQEQRRIAAILDRADSLRAIRRRTLELRSRVVQSIFESMFALDQVRMPFGSLISGLRNGVSPASGGGVVGRVLTLSAITQGKFDPSASKVSTFAAEPDGSQRVSSDDLLICRGNGNRSLVGTAVCSLDDRPDVIFPDTVIAARFDKTQLDPVFLEVAWAQRATRNQLEAGARTTNGTFKINQQTIGKVAIPVPPLIEQREFSHRVSAIPHLPSSQLDELFASLQSRAFSGRL